MALTTSLNLRFGNGISIPGTGVLVNNSMDDCAAVSVQGLDTVCLAPRDTTGSACGGSASLHWGFLGPRRWLSSHRQMAFGGADPLRRDESHVHPAP